MKTLSLKFRIILALAPGILVALASVAILAETHHATAALLEGIGLFVAGMIAAGMFRKIFHDLGNSCEGFANSAGTLASTSSQIRHLSREIDQANRKQTEALQKSSSAIQEVSTTLDRNAENAKMSAEIADCSTLAAEKGQQAVREMVSTIGAMNESNSKIVRQVEESNRRIGEISKVIAEIGEKTKIINDIVFQTKLLSFNASIEAARAGEQGKGFAIVAEEVGNLAQVSGTAAKEISDMLGASMGRVDSIISETRAQVEILVKEGKVTADKGTAVAGQCRSALEEIVQNVHQVNAMLKEIASVTMEQTQGMAEISTHLNGIEKASLAQGSAGGQFAHLASQVASEANGISRLNSRIESLVRGTEIAGPASLEPAL